MDHDLLRQTCRDLEGLPCEFERALLSGHACCTQSQRFLVAEREGLQCQSAHAQAGCRAFLEALREAASFALKARNLQGTLANTQNLRLQIGGLRGLRSLRDTSADPGVDVAQPIEDIFALLAQTRRQWDGLADLPYGKLVQAIAAFQPRRKTRI